MQLKLIISKRKWKYHFRLSLPVNDAFKISFPVWADTTKRSEIKFKGKSLKTFFGYVHAAWNLTVNESFMLIFNDFRQFSTWKFRDSDVEIATEMIHGNYRNINDVLTRFLIVFEVQRNWSSRNFNSNNDIHWQSVWLYQLLSCNSI